MTAFRLVDDVEACDFYHAINLPISGPQSGSWDLRGRFDDYTGRVAFDGRTVLDIGTASGFLTFEAEERGATVTSFDIADATLSHELPINGSLFTTDHAAWLAKADTAFDRMKNSYWLAHRELNSNAACVYGDIYDISPDTVGSFDIVLIGQLLIHLRDGLSALEAAASVCNQTLVVTEGSFDDGQPVARLSGRSNRPDVAYAWYQYSHGWYREVLTMLGFPTVTITTDTYLCRHASHAHEIELATIVARRNVISS